MKIHELNYNDGFDFKVMKLKAKEDGIHPLVKFSYSSIFIGGRLMFSGVLLLFYSSHSSLKPFPLSVIYQYIIVLPFVQAFELH
jgi:hypothetical protein